MNNWDQLFDKMELHKCEIEIDGRVCGRPTFFQSAYTWHEDEQRFCWVCQDCVDALKPSVFQDPQ
jgi:hypothetical protein